MDRPEPSVAYSTRSVHCLEPRPVLPAQVTVMIPWVLCHGGIFLQDLSGVFFYPGHKKGTHHLMSAPFAMKVCRYVLVEIFISTNILQQIFFDVNILC